MIVALEPTPIPISLRKSWSSTVASHASDSGADHNWGSSGFGARRSHNQKGGRVSRSPLSQFSKLEYSSGSTEANGLDCSRVPTAHHMPCHSRYVKYLSSVGRLP